MNAIDSFRIARPLHSINDIKNYYDSCLNAIDNYHSRTGNKDFTSCFLGWKDKDIVAQSLKLKRELSSECSLMVVANIESLFRIDSYARIEFRFKGKIHDNVKKLLLRKKSIGRVNIDDLIDVWKQEFLHEAQLFRDLNLAFMFRNWFAHGRYWHLSDSVEKHFDFTSVYLLRQSIVDVLGSTLVTIDNGSAHHLK